MLSRVMRVTGMWFIFLARNSIDIMLDMVHRSDTVRVAVGSIHWKVITRSSKGADLIVIVPFLLLLLFLFAT